MLIELIEDVSDSLTLIARNLDRIANNMESKPTFNNNNNSYQSKDVDRDSSEYKNKKRIYITKTINKSIKEPKPSSLEYYQIKYNEEKKLMNNSNLNNSSNMSLLELFSGSGSGDNCVIHKQEDLHKIPAELICEILTSLVD